MGLPEVQRKASLPPSCLHAPRPLLLLLLVVLAFGHEPKVEQVPVTSNCKGTTFPDSMIEAWKVDGWLVVDSHREWGSPTDSFRADGHTGWGQCVIFGPEDHDIGKVMEY